MEHDKDTIRRAIQIMRDYIRNNIQKKPELFLTLEILDEYEKGKRLKRPS